MNSARANIRDPRALWRWLFALTLLYVAFKLCGAAVYGLSHGLTVPQVDANRAIEWGDGAYVIASPLIYLACLILTWMLTYRLMKNLHELRSAQVDISPGWAVAYYIVPVANLIMPPRVAGEIWRGTFWRGDRVREPNGIVSLWWTTVLVTIATNIIADSGLADSGAFMVQFSFDLNPSHMSPMAAASSAFAGLSAILYLNTFGRIVRGQVTLIEQANAKERDGAAAGP
jgi:hypothetical protein